MDGSVSPVQSITHALKERLSRSGKFGPDQGLSVIGGVVETRGGIDDSLDLFYVGVKQPELVETIHPSPNIIVPHWISGTTNKSKSLANLKILSVKKSISPRPVELFFESCRCRVSDRSTVTPLARSPSSPLVQGSFATRTSRLRAAYL